MVELSTVAFEQEADGGAVGGGCLRLGREGSALHRLVGRLHVIACVVGHKGWGGS